MMNKCFFIERYKNEQKKEKKEFKFPPKYSMQINLDWYFYPAQNFKCLLDF